MLKEVCVVANIPLHIKTGSRDARDRTSLLPFARVVYLILNFLGMSNSFGLEVSGTRVENMQMNWQ